MLILEDNRQLRIYDEHHFYASKFSTGYVHGPGIGPACSAVLSSQLPFLDDNRAIYMHYFPFLCIQSFFYRLRSHPCCSCGNSCHPCIVLVHLYVVSRGQRPSVPVLLVPGRENQEDHVLYAVHEQVIVLVPGICSCTCTV